MKRLSSGTVRRPARRRGPARRSASANAASAPAREECGNVTALRDPSSSVATGSATICRSSGVRRAAKETTCRCDRLRSDVRNRVEVSTSTMSERMTTSVASSAATAAWRTSAEIRLGPAGLNVVDAVDNRMERRQARRRGQVAQHLIVEERPGRNGRRPRAPCGTASGPSRRRNRVCCRGRHRPPSTVRSRSTIITSRWRSTWKRRTTGRRKRGGGFPVDPARDRRRAGTPEHLEFGPDAAAFRRTAVENCISAVVVRGGLRPLKPSGRLSRCRGRRHPQAFQHERPGQPDPRRPEFEPPADAGSGTIGGKRSNCVIPAAGNRRSTMRGSAAAGATSRSAAAKAAPARG